MKSENKNKMEDEYDTKTGNLILNRVPREKIVGYEKGIDGKADYSKGIKAIILLVEIREKFIDEKKRVYQARILLNSPGLTWLREELLPTEEQIKAILKFKEESKLEKEINL